jgi:predicted RNA methylase
MTTTDYPFTEEGKALDQYFTSPILAKKLVEWATLSRGDRVLEPSAGDGGLVRHMPKNIRLTAVELDPAMAAKLREIKHPTLEVHEGDFLKWKPKRDHFDVAVMNSPYGNDADGQHAAHALRFATRVVLLVRTNFEYGVGRFNRLFRWATVTRRAVLVRRAPFYGPACEGHTARHDYVVLELVRRETDRLEDPSSDPVETEWWTEAWK